MAWPGHMLEISRNQPSADVSIHRYFTEMQSEQHGALPLMVGWVISPMLRELLFFKSLARLRESSIREPRTAENLNDLTMVAMVGSEMKSD